MTSRVDYAALANDYARHRKVHPGVLDYLVRTAVETEAGSILEVGCGTGNYCVALHKATGADVTGIDPSDAMLAKAEQQPGRVIWRSGRAETIPVSDGSVDLVFSVDVIHHIEDRPAYWCEARRVLRPGGVAVTATDSEADIARRRPLSNYFPSTVKHELARYPTIELIRSEMEAEGFTPIDCAHVELEYGLSDIAAYRDKAFSSLHLITDLEFQAGIDRLEADIRSGPISAQSLYTLDRASTHS